MIGRLQGILATKKAPAILLDVNGVGYELETPMSTFYDLPETGSRVTLFTHLVVREDAHLLYGFLRDAERQLFRTLIRVSGVGPRLALALLSGMTRQEFARCIHENDISALTRLPGVGRKTAERLVVELRDRLKDMGDLAPTLAMGGVAADSPVAEAVDALVALGYKPQEASRMVRLVPGDGLASEDIIRQALQGAVR